MEGILFPHDKIRLCQKDLIQDIKTAIDSKSHIIAHAPTGLGKTAASLSVTLKKAIDNNLVIMFLTSRHTQHKIVIDTLRDIKTRHDVEFGVSDLIAKKFMCAQPGIEVLKSSDFVEYCKTLKKEGGCQFYLNLKKGEEFSMDTKRALEKIKEESPLDNKGIVNISKGCSLCPYEIGIILAKDAKVIVCDYQYIFNDIIRDKFLVKIGKELKDIIVIIDEGHNLSARIRDSYTSKLSTITINRAIKEAKKYDNKRVLRFLNNLFDILLNYSKDLESTKEKLIKKDDFCQKVNSVDNYSDIIEELEELAVAVKLERKQSSVESVAKFLRDWELDDSGYTRIFSKMQTYREDILTLSYRCLDPSLISGPIIQKTYSTILMSGTLNPTSMYRDLLGFPKNTIEKEYESPFDEENKMHFIVPMTTTKFSMRSDLQYEKIGEICADIANIIPGNCAIFFPSYSLRDEVHKTFFNNCKKKTFLERASLGKEEKEEMLEEFKKCKNEGGVLLGAISGSFSEGIDLPGDLLKCVVVVGLPLSQPDLETKELIEYFNVKFSRGWDYGYIFPAFNKTLQSAGRCIRSETDKGVMVFLDERYSWPNYIRCFPADFQIKISKEYKEAINWFFEK